MLSRACRHRYCGLPTNDVRYQLDTHISSRIEFGYFDEVISYRERRVELNRLAVEALPRAVLSAKTAKTGDEDGPSSGNTTCSAAPLLAIPDAKLVADIVSYLDVPGLNSVMRASKAFRAYARSDGVWEPHLKRMLGRVFDTLVSEEDRAGGEELLTEQPSWRNSSAFVQWAESIGWCGGLPVLGHFRVMEEYRCDPDDFENLWHFCNGSGEYCQLKYSDWLMYDVPLIDYYKGAGYFAASGLVRYIDEETEKNLEMAVSTNRCVKCGMKVWSGDHSKCKSRIPTVKKQRRKSFGPDLCRIKLFVMDYRSKEE